MQALVKELAIRRVENSFRRCTHDNSRYLAWGTVTAPLPAAVLFCSARDTFIPHATLSLRTGGGASSQGVALADSG